MEGIEPQESLYGQEAEPEPLPEYQPPRVVTYSGDELLEALGPMQACTPFLAHVLVCG